MKKIPSIAGAVALLASAYVFFAYGIAPLAGLVREEWAAPLPSSLVTTYTLLAAVGVLIYYSVSDERWREFVGPVRAFIRNDAPPSRAKTLCRGAVLAGVPLALGYAAYARASASPEPPADPPGIHFSLPNKYVGVENPLEWTPQNIREGGVLYTRNCAPCHGDALDGEGPAARAWQPKPANFRDEGTLAQLPENYVFWRIKEGGPGAPRGSIEYRSAMPVWDGVLTDEQIWKIIMYEYTQAGKRPARRE